MQFSEYLKQLVDSSQRVSPVGLRHLAGLYGGFLKELRLIWPSIDVQRRREVVRLAVELAEDNVDLDFSDLFQVGLKDPDSEVRLASIEGLAEAEDRTTAEAILTLFTSDHSPEVRAAAATALGRFALQVELGKLTGPLAERIEQSLLRAVETPDLPDELRRRALEAVSHRSLPAVAAAIERAYASPDLKMRASAICAMGRNCDRRWLDIIGSELASGEPELRYEAARASGELGEPVLVRPLARLLVDRDPEVRVAVVGALGEIGGRQARQALKYCLESDDLVIRDAAAEALKNLDFLEDPLDVDREVGG